MSRAHGFAFYFLTAPVSKKPSEHNEIHHPSFIIYI